MDKQKLAAELTELNILALYDFMCPLDYMSGLTAEMINHRRENAIKRYRNDAIFHSRVELLVARTLDIVEQNRKNQGAVLERGGGR